MCIAATASSFFVLSNTSDPIVEPFFYAVMIILGIAVGLFPNRFPHEREPRVVSCHRQVWAVVGCVGCLAAPLALLQPISGLYQQKKISLTTYVFLLASASKALQCLFTYVCAKSERISNETAAVVDFYIGGFFLLFARSATTVAKEQSDVVASSFMLMGFELIGALQYVVWLRWGLLRETRRANAKRAERNAAETDEAKATLDGEIDAICAWRARQFNLLMVNFETDSAVESSCIGLSFVFYLLANAAALSGMPANLDGKSVDEKLGLLGEALLIQLSMEIVTDFLIGCMLGVATGGYAPARLGWREHARIAFLGAIVLSTTCLGSYGVGMCDSCHWATQEAAQSHPCRMR